MYFSRHHQQLQFTDCMVNLNVSLKQGFIAKLLKVFDFKSKVLTTLSFVDPVKCQHLPSSTFDKIEEKICISFDKNATKLEYHEFMIDDDVTASINETGDNVVQFWLNVSKLKSPMGEFKYSFTFTFNSDF